MICKFVYWNRRLAAWQIKFDLEQMAHNFPRYSADKLHWGLNDLIVRPSASL